NAGTVAGTGFTGMESLVGGAGDDSFTFASTITNFGGSIDGGGGSNTVAATDGTNSWSITGTNTFTFNGTGTSFSNIQNLTGGSGNDTFTVASGVTSFNGAIDGGSGGTDTLATTSGTNAWTISGTNAGTLNGTGTTFTNIDVLAGGGGTDTLTSTIAGTVAWSITGTNTGTVAGTGFTGMESLVGGAGNDSFTLASGVGSFNGSIDGG